ncbi:MAG: thiamine pyrophosphate-dependent enzyme, partial [Gammaproteobacteria bacterium]
VDEAMRQLTGGRPRPVEIEMPMDVMAQRAEVSLTSAAAALPPPPIDEEAIDAAVALLAQAKRPMIVVGSGAQHACAEVLALAEHLQAPVMAKRNGKGIVPSSHYLSANIPLGHRTWSEADAVVAIGTRLRMPLVMWGKDDALKIVRIDIDPTEIARICRPEVGLVGDAAVLASALLEALRRKESARNSREAELRERRQSIEREMRETVGPQMAYLDAIRAVLPQDGIFVDEVTQVGFASWYGFPVERPRQHITAGYQGTLGFGFATALGVVAAHPNKRVVQVSGDGGFLFTVQELATAVQYRLPLVSIVFNDRRFTNVQRQQKEWFGGRVLCSDLHNPDFVKLAEAFGAMGERIATPEELPAALERAFAAGVPAIIEVDVREFFPSPWRYILMPQNRGAVCR